jgi:predicted secreted protein
MRGRIDRVIRTLLIAALAALSSAVEAQTPEPARFNQFDLQAEASREVQNDLMTAVLYVEANDANPAQLATTLNRTMTEALKVAQEYKATKARSGGTQTYPLSDRNGRITGWRGRADLRLEGKDFKEIGTLIGRLQASMQLGGINFQVSPELRRQTENELISEALAAFRTRADIVRQAVGGKTVKIRRVGLNMGGSMPGPRPMIASRAESMSAASAPPPPTFEGGTSQVQVSAQGTVEIE